MSMQRPPELDEEQERKGSVKWLIPLIIAVALLVLAINKCGGEGESEKQESKKTTQKMKISPEKQPKKYLGEIQLATRSLNVAQKL